MEEKRRIILGIIIIAFALFIIFSLESSISPYVSVSEVIQKGEMRNVQVNGSIVPNSTIYFPNNNTRIFEITDGKNMLRVIYTGALTNYQEGIPTVVIGDYFDGYFHAKKVLLKCPSKYQAMEENFSGSYIKKS
jgi:cytochrome c-type biogenesis protein CcmE